jgi:hypothetical protein
MADAKNRIKQRKPKISFFDFYKKSIKKTNRGIVLDFEP